MSKSNNFGKNLAVLRKYRNLTQKELACALGVSDSTISMYENNQRHPNIDDIVEIALFQCINRCFVKNRNFE
ncbi:helix-turn-helix domain-containing protein [Gemella sanguinis]